MSLRVLGVLLFFFSSFEVSASVSPSDSSTAVINIYRPKNFAGSASKVRILFNGQKVNKLSNGTKMKFIVHSEGVIAIKALSKSPYTFFTLPAEIEHGKEYFFKIHWETRGRVTVIQKNDTVGSEEFYDKTKYKRGFKAEVFEEDINNPIPIEMKKLPTKEGKRKVESREPRISGSGIMISDQGHIVTNFHVISESDFIYVKGINGDLSKKLKASVVVKDEVNDLAILKIEGDSTGMADSIPFTLKTTLADVGESIFVLGYPLTSTMGDEIKLTNGIVSSKTGFKGNIALYQISAPVQPGNSGGPLFDSNGNLIGIVSSKHLAAENVSYAIKSNYVMNLVNILPEPIPMPERSLLTGKTLPEQVKLVKDMVVLIEVH